MITLLIAWYLIFTFTLSLVIAREPTTFAQLLFVTIGWPIIFPIAFIISLLETK